MSDIWAKLKELKGVLAAIVSTATVFILIGGALMEWRISVNVTKALSAQDLATDTNIVTMNTNIADNTRTGSENGEDIEHNRRNVEAAFAALMGRAVPRPDDD